MRWQLVKAASTSGTRRCSPSKAAAAETGGAFALWDVTTRPGEEPQVHVHETEDEIFYLIAGSMTFRCGDMAFDDQDHGFVYVPGGTPHTYTIHSNEARL